MPSEVTLHVAVKVRDWCEGTVTLVGLTEQLANVPEAVGAMNRDSKLLLVNVYPTETLSPILSDLEEAQGAMISALSLQSPVRRRARCAIVDAASRDGSPA